MTTITSTEPVESLAAERAKLQARRDALQSRVTALQEREASLSAERTAHLVADRGKDAAALGGTLTTVRDDHAALAAAVADLDRAIADLSERERQAAERRELEVSTAAFTAARERFEQLRRDVVARFQALIVDDVVGMLNGLRAAHQVAGDAHARAKRADGAGNNYGNWDGNLFTFHHAPEHQLLNQLEYFANNRVNAIRAAAGEPSEPTQDELRARALAAQRGS